MSRVILIHTRTRAERSKQVVVMRRSQAMLLVYMFIIHEEYIYEACYRSLHEYARTRGYLLLIVHEQTSKEDKRKVVARSSSKKDVFYSYYIISK